MSRTTWHGYSDEELQHVLHHWTRRLAGTFDLVRDREQASEMLASVQREIGEREYQRSCFTMASARQHCAFAWALGCSDVRILISVDRDGSEHIGLHLFYRERSRGSRTRATDSHIATLDDWAAWVEMTEIVS